MSALSTDDLLTRALALNSDQRKTLLHQLRKSAPSSNSLHLAAHIVLSPDSFESPRTIRAQLKQSLPVYMIPKDLFLQEKLPLTRNGKVDKTALANFEQAPDQLSKPDFALGSPTQETLASVWKRLLGLSSIGYEDDFFELGGDSISAIQVVSETRKQGIELRVSHIFKYRTIANLAEQVAPESEKSQSNESTIPLKALPEQSEDRSGYASPAGSASLKLTQTLPFTPIQNWFFGNEFQNSDHWNQSILLEVAPTIAYSEIRSAFSNLYEKRDVFRLVTKRNPTGLSQSIKAFTPSMVPLECINITDHKSDSIDDITSETANALHAKISLDKGELIKAAFLVTESYKSNRLLLVAHHFCVDAISWRLIIDDLNQWLKRGEKQKTSTSTRSAASFASWSQALFKLGQSDACRNSEAFWRNQDYKNCAKIPLDMGDSSQNTEGSASSLTRRLDKHVSKAILEKSTSRVQSVQTFLLAALGQCLKDWLTVPKVLVGLEGHGREEIDPSVEGDSVVGWLTSYFPIVVDLQYAESPQQALNDTRAQLTKIPDNGLSFGLLKYSLTEDRISNIPEPQITLNYLGKEILDLDEDLPLKYSANCIGIDRDLRNKRNCLFEINARIVEERICIDWRYSKCIHDKDTITSLMDSFIKQLEQLAQPLFETSPKTDSLFESYPLSDAQSSLLLHSLSNPENDQGQLLLRGDLIGELRPERFEQAWQSVIDRHPALRVTADWKNRVEPSLIVHAKVAAKLTFLDLSGKPKESQELEQQNLIDANQHDAIDLEILPAISMTLIRLSKQKHVFQWKCHHLFLDGWSSAIVLQDLLDGLCESSTHQLPDTSPALTFRNYYRWIREAPPSEAADHWRLYLSDASACLIAQTVEAVTIGKKRVETEIVFNSEQLSALKETANQLKVTVGSLAIACWSLAMANLTGQKSVCFGLSISGRELNLADVDSMVGNLANVVPVRIEIEPEHPLAALTENLLQSQERASRYGHYSVSRIMAWTDLKTDSPLFDTVLTIANYPKIQSQGSIQLENFQGDSTATVPLAASFIIGSKTKLSLSYDVEWLTADRVCFISDLYCEILHKLCERPSDSIASFLNDASAKAYQALPVVLNSKQNSVQTKTEQSIKRSKTVPSSRETEKRLLAILKETLSIESCSVSDSFFDLGGTSIQAVHFFGAIEDAFQKKLPLSSLFKHPSVASLAPLVDGIQSIDRTFRNLVEIRGGSGLPPIYFIHAIGLGVLFYRDLANRIDPRIPVYGFEPIGADGKEKPSSSIHDMADRYLKELKRARPKGPYILLGHCFGAAIALEMAKRLREDSNEIPLIIAIDGEAPRSKDFILPQSPNTIKQMMSPSKAFRSLEKQIRKPFRVIKDYWVLKYGTRDQRFARINRIVRESLGRAFEAHRSEPYLGKVVAFQSTDSSIYTRYPNHTNTETHWRKIAPCVDLVKIDCYHHEIITEPHVQEVANIITLRLATIEPFSYVVE